MKAPLAVKSLPPTTYPTKASQPLPLSNEIDRVSHDKSEIESPKHLNPEAT